MADISITAANVLASASAVIKYGTAFETITQGQVVALDTTVKLCDNNSGTAAIRQPVGIAITGASAGQRVYYVTEDTEFQIGATILTCDTLWTSSNPGGITKTAADNTTGKYLGLLGIMKDTTIARIKITYSSGVIL